MRGKKLLAGLLVGVMIVCLVPVMGYGEEKSLEEVRECIYESKASQMDKYLLDARIDYIMKNPDSFLDVRFIYDSAGIEAFTEGIKHPLLQDVDTKGKLIVYIRDNRGVFSGKSGVDLLELMTHLYAVLACVGIFSPETHILAIFMDEDYTHLAYFYKENFYWPEE